jgi:hypothetical protein
MAVYVTQNSSLSRRLFFQAASLYFALAILPSLSAQDPVVDRIQATDLSPGKKASVVVSGKQLTGAMSLWTPVGTLKPKEGTDLTKDQPVALEGDIRTDALPGLYPARMVTSHGCSEAAWIVVDDLPFVGIAGEADDRKSGQLISLPCCVGGQINPVVSKFFRVALTAGQSVSLDVFARRLGSDLDPLLRVTGPSGVEVAYSDDRPGAEGDTQLQFTAMTDGEYRIEVRDIRYSGGARYFFHLRLGNFSVGSSTSPRVAQSGQKVALISATGEVLTESSPQPLVDVAHAITPVTFRAAEADTSVFGTVFVTNEATQAEAEPNDTREQAMVVVPEAQVLTGVLQAKGDVDWFKISTTEAVSLLVMTRTREMSSPTDVLLELFNAEGVKMVENDDVGLRDAELSAQLPAAGDFFLKVSEIAGRGGSEWAYALDIFRGRKAVRITAPSDRLNVPRGGSATMALTVRRIQYDGPLKIEAVGLPAALTMMPFTIGAKQSTVPIVLTAADPAATASDADWGPVSVKVSSPDGASSFSSELQLAPPAAKKTDAEIFRSARLRNDLFTAIAPAAQFSFTVDPAAVTVTQGMAATLVVKSTRAAEWTMPIDIALAVPADQLPPGITIAGGSMAAGDLTVTITAAADAAVGPFTLFLQGKAKKDNVEPVHPVPPIVVEVKTK